MSFSQRFSEIPVSLIQQVNGDASEAAFRYIGGCIADGIESKLAEVKSLNSLGEPVALSGAQAILDFGCGLGRVILYLAERAPHAHITGFDINPLMIKWARYLHSNPKLSFTNSTLELANQSFDLVIAISVFTHLDTTTDFWLSEIHRLLKKDGFAIITYQDETLFNEMKLKGTLASTANLETKFVCGAGTSEGGATMGTFYTSDYFRTILESCFTVRLLAPRGLFGHQSLAVVTRKDVSLDRGALLLAYAKSIEGELASQHSTIVNANESNVELRQEIEKLTSRLKDKEIGVLKRLESKHQERADLETYTQLLWKADDERMTYLSRFRAARSSFAWVFYKLLEGGKKAGSEAPSTTDNIYEFTSTKVSLHYYFYDSPFRIYRTRAQTLRGWCRAISGLPICEIRAWVDGAAFVGTYGEKVLNILLPNSEVVTECPCGFSVTILVPHAGRHKLTFEVRGAEGPWQRWLEFPIWAVE